MTINEYKALFPNEYVYCEASINDVCVEQGMLLFDETASWFAGPFEGNYAYYVVRDYRNYPTNRWYKLITAEELQRIRFSTSLPGDYLRKPAENEEQLQKRLKTLTPKQLKEWQKRVDEYKIDRATVEYPIALKLMGNDDASYTKFYPSLEAMRKELDLFLSDQPLNYPLHIGENGFVFTN